MRYAASTRPRGKFADIPGQMVMDVFSDDPDAGVIPPRRDHPALPGVPAAAAATADPVGLGHPATSHHGTRTGALAWCSSYGPPGLCPCEKFTEPKKTSL